MGALTPTPGIEGRSTVLARPGFDPQPTLTGRLVHLRPLAEGDWDALYAVAADPLIWAVHPARDRWREPVFRAFFEEALAGRGALVALDPDTGAVIGSSRYAFARAGPGEVEIGWTFLARDRWGGATNAAMKRLMIAHALRSLDRALFYVGADNGRSRRAMDKIGGVLVDRDVTALAPHHVVFAVDRETFARGPLAHGPV